MRVPHSGPCSLDRMQTDLLALCMPAVVQAGRTAWPLKSKVALLLSAVLRQQGPEAYNQMLPQLLQQSVEGPTQVW